MKVDDIETFWVLSRVDNVIPENNDVAYVWQKINVVPERTLYFEDNFNEGVETSGITYENGTSSNTAYPDHGTWRTVSGNNALYALAGETTPTTAAYCSGGSAHVVRVSNFNTPSAGKWPSMTFTFAGTGFDLVSLTDSHGGTFYVTVKDSNGNKVGKSKIVDTYYGYTYGELYYNTTEQKIVSTYTEGETVYLYDAYGVSTEEALADPDTYIVINGKVYALSGEDQAKGWVVDKSASTAMYQTPVISLKGLAYGVYTVTIEARFTTMFGHYKTDDTAKWFDLCVDGIRVYDPAQGAVLAADAYAKTSEPFVTTVPVKTIIVGNDDYLMSSYGGALFIDGTEGIDADDLGDYLAASPNNEVYLTKGQSIAFYTRTSFFDKLQIGMRSTGAPIAANGITIAYDGNGNVSANNLTAPLTATGINYTFNENFTGVVTITNNSDTVLSLTDFRLVTNQKYDPNAPLIPTSYSANTLSAAVAMLSMVSADLSIDEETVTTEAAADGTVKLTATTTSDVATLIVRDENGDVITPVSLTSEPGEGDTLVWMVVLEERESGKYTYTLQGAYENGYTGSDPITVTVEVTLVGDEPQTPAEKESFFTRLISAIKEFLERLFSILK